MGDYLEEVREVIRILRDINMNLNKIFTELNYMNQEGTVILKDQN